MSHCKETHEEKLITIAVAHGSRDECYVLYRRAHSDTAPAYRTAAVERGKHRGTVSATRRSRVRTVQVGTQVSGQISEIYVDFNSK